MKGSDKQCTGALRALEDNPIVLRRHPRCGHACSLMSARTFCSGAGLARTTDNRPMCAAVS